MPEVETHLVMSKWAKTTIELETPWTAREVAALADFSHSPADQAATISSGSFRYRRHDRYSLQYENACRHSRGVMPKGWVTRGGRGAQKRGASWLVPREMPLSTIHLENMLALPAWAWRWSRRCQLTNHPGRLTISPIISSPGCWISLASTITKRAAGTACAWQNNLHRRSNNGF